MPVMRFSQASLFDPTAISPGILAEGSLPKLLSELGDALVPGFLLAEWRGASRRGRAAWPASKLLALELLRWFEGGVNRLAACRRAKTDLAWRAAMGLPSGGRTPSEKTLREFETWLMERTETCDLRRYDVLFEGVVRRVSGRITGAVWMMDGTPMYCFGALQGTVRMLGDGLRGLLRRWGRWRGGTLKEVAHRLRVPWVASKSIKGGLGADWRDADSRRGALERLVKDVERVVGELNDRLVEVSHPRRDWIRRRCASLLRVIEKDIRADAEGRLFVQWKAGSDRQVSITDPEARSGRKSRHNKFKGFKLDILGDLVSGLIAGVKVFPGNQGEGDHGIELLQRTKRLALDIERVLADSAYGGTPNRLEAMALGIDMVAPPSALQAKASDALQKHEYSVDFATMVATCPNGVSTDDHRLAPFNGEVVTVFEWPYDTCRHCPLHARCVPKMKVGEVTRRGRRKGKRLRLNANEQALRSARAEWEDRREEYRIRGQGERLIMRMVRYGTRQARAFGLEAANLQAHMAAMAANLDLLARLLGDSPPEHPSLPLWNSS